MTRILPWLMLPLVIGLSATMALLPTSSAVHELPPSKYDKHLFELDRQAIDVAYKEHVQQLFATWMKDATGEPARGAEGVRRARRAYIGAMEAIEKREGEQ